MSIDKPDVVEKTDSVISPLPIAEKVVAADINELRRASDETVDVVNELVEIIEDRPVGQIATFPEVIPVPIANTTDFYKIVWNGATPSALSSQFSFADGDMIYDGIRKRVFQAAAIVSLTAGNNQTIQVRIFVNGTGVLCSTQEAVTAAGGRGDGVTAACLVELETGDIVSARVRNTTGTDDISVKNLNLSAIPVGPVELINGGA